MFLKTFMAIVFTLFLSFSAQAKRFEIELDNEIIVFFDECEIEYHLNDKEELTHKKLSLFFLETVAPTLLRRKSWTGDKGDNVHNIFYTLLKKFEESQRVFYVYYAEDIDD